MTDLQTAERLLPAGPPPDLTALHARLVAGAESAGLLDVAYATVDTPLGLLLLAATPRGLVRVAYEVEGTDAVLERLAERLSPRILYAPARLAAAAAQLQDYLAGRRRTFDLPLDHALSSGFYAAVRLALPGIGYGQTRTYAEVARGVGRPTAVRAVGSACARNPLPVVVPCHRVLRSDGGLGGYIGGVEAKRTLLALEAAA
ncbi:MAG: cysteine methyltransferase [Friedmanniella sp.]|nr:cysteine methyltransferase [Friedmanniella sp.]